MSAPTNVLTINFGGIGDEILFLPALKDLRRALPGAQITLLVEPRSRSVEQVTDLIDSVITFDIKKRPLLPGDLWQLVCLIRQGKYDLVISSGSSPQVAALLFLSGIKVRVGYGSNPLAKLLLTHPVPLLRDQYAGGMYHDLLKGLDLYLEQTGPKKESKDESPGDRESGTAGPDQTEQIPQIMVKEESRAAMGKLLAERFADPGTAGSAEVKTVLIHPGTSTMAVQKGIIKTWPTESWLSLIQKICAAPESPSFDLPFKLRVVLAGGPDDRDVIADLERQLDEKGGRPANFQSFAGLTKGLSDLAGLIDLSEAIVCVDSAPMHLAVGLNKKTVALFGPTEPEKLIPRSPRFKVLADRPTGYGAVQAETGSINSGPGSTNSGPGSTNSGPGSTNSGPGSTNSGPGSTDSGPGSTNSGPGSTDSGPGSTSSGPGSTGAGINGKGPEAKAGDYQGAATRPPRSLLDGLGVRLPPDIVYQSLLDLLKAE